MRKFINPSIFFFFFLKKTNLKFNELLGKSKSPPKGRRHEKEWSTCHVYIYIYIYEHLGTNKCVYTWQTLHGRYKYQPS